MRKGLTSTKHFGFSASWLRAGLGCVADGAIISFSRAPELAAELGMGVIQLEALGAWMRYAGVVTSGPGGKPVDGVGAVGSCS